MRRFVVTSQEIVDNRVRLRGSEFHHLKHVLRLEVGAAVELHDERGTTHRGIIRGISRDAAEIALTHAAPAEQYGFRLTLAQSVLKRPAMDLVMEKATELGVHEIVPFVSERTVARIPPEKHAERTARWQRIAQAAAKQSGNPPPTIRPPVALSEALGVAPENARKIFFWEGENALHLKQFAQTVSDCRSLYVMVGPEGGFAAHEVETARRAGFVSISLGSAVLRAETASLAAVSVCRFLWGDVRFPPLPRAGRVPSIPPSLRTGREAKTPHG